MALDLCWTNGHDATSMIGTGRKGRRKGSKNRSYEERIVETEKKNELKRINERQRVRNISYQYNRLRKALGDPHPEKKLRKQHVLNACIDHIYNLQKILSNQSADGDCASEFGSEQSPSVCSGGDNTLSCVSEIPMQSSSTSRLQCEESFCSLSPLEVSPPLSFQQDCTTTISPPQHHYYYPPLPAPHLPSMTGVSPPCQFQISPLFEWNMAPSVEAGIEEYSFFTTTHPQFTPSPPMSRQMFPPPPLHHLY